MTPPTTALWQLADMKFDGDLAWHIVQWQTAGQSLRWISGEIEHRTNLAISHETVRVWASQLGLAAQA
jgi:transposase-like protein